MKVARLTPRAEADLQELVNFIAADNPEAAEKTFFAVLNAADFLAANPSVGKSIIASRGRHREVRWFVLPRFRRYILFYVPTEEGVAVIRILHSARDWTRFF